MYGLRRPWRDGTTGILFEPGEFIEKLLALVPAPRGHLVRYHGVLAGHSRWRAQVVRDRGSAGVAPGGVGPGPEPEPAVAPDNTPGREAAPESGELRERRLTWSQLMLRVFEVDILKCPGCGGRRELVAVITQAEVIVAFLSSLGLPTRAPPMAPAREVGQREDDPGEPPPF